MPCGFPWQACLPESVRGEACACKNSREGGVQTSVALASTVLLGCQKLRNCTLGQLTSPRFESAFFASFLCRFGQRNDVPPRTVANSDKEKSQLKQTAKAESSNPALTPTANAENTNPASTPTANPKPLPRASKPPPARAAPLTPPSAVRSGTRATTDLRLRSNQQASSSSARSCAPAPCAA